jgi:hypothetical protein
LYALLNDDTLLFMIDLAIGPLKISKIPMIRINRAAAMIKNRFTCCLFGNFCLIDGGNFSKRSLKER